PGAERFSQLLNSSNGTKLINLYGPTEATVDVSYYNCLPGETAAAIPIGKPIDNIRLYIVDKHLHPQPIGVGGELCISGVGLARGYLNRPELTMEKFDHYLWNSLDYRDEKQERTDESPQVIYKTGDLARWLPDGNIEFLGRIDHQVKMRGYRIELGEIEYRLLKHEAIKGAVVLLNEAAGSKNNYLSAYIATEREFNVSQLREFLSRELPAHMIPSHFLQIDKIPLTSNGKVDRKALALMSKQVDSGTAYVAPRSIIEKKIAEIWKEILNLDKIGVNDNYFELGGTSFDIIRINKRLREVFQIDIAVVTMFRFTTVHSMSEYLNNNNQGTETMEIRERSAALERGKADRMRRLRKRQGAASG
ncbi:MAG: AMP-binding protein, partial [bacterium]|nr:AMP-binding protein [bacterium]